MTRFLLIPLVLSCSSADSCFYCLLNVGAWFRENNLMKQCVLFSSLDLGCFSIHSFVEFIGTRAREIVGFAGSGPIFES